jgi:hypothetical protein
MSWRSEEGDGKLLVTGTWFQWFRFGSAGATVASCYTDRIRLHLAMDQRYSTHSWGLHILTLLSVAGAIFPAETASPGLPLEKGHASITANNLDGRNHGSLRWRQKSVPLLLFLTSGVCLLQGN